MEELCKGVMYFKILNVLDRSDHVPLVRKTGGKKVRKVRKKVICLEGKVLRGKKST